MATTNTTTAQSTTTKTAKVTNAQMMRICVSVLAAMPEDALQRLCGEFRAQDVVSKARAHCATLEKSSARTASGPNKTQLENDAYLKTLVAWWESNGETAYRAGELANVVSEQGVLPIAKVSTQKMVGILNRGVESGQIVRTFNGKDGWFFTLATDETTETE
jgi:hypothetical protein|nr:MAG TPA_asm: hypothetical protein [Caudoviricetes sp.]